jgi:hypothetical protein
MTASMAAGWVIAIVVAIVLFSWVGAVLWADSHPGWKHQSKLPKYEVTGGAFQALDGGRQLMPIPGERPAPTEEELARSGGVPAQRAAAAREPAGSRVPGQRAATEQGATAATSGERSGEPRLTAGSKLRLVRFDLYAGPAECRRAGDPPLAEPCRNPRAPGGLTTAGTACRSNCA